MRDHYFVRRHKPVEILFFGLQEVDCVFDRLGHQNTDIKRVLRRELGALQMYASGAVTQHASVRDRLL